MVVSHGPAKFYGTSLPRPRFYTELKFNDHRVDPPVPVTDALMSWAHKAHWSMGGLEEKRLRLQGKIEGNVDKLRTQRDKISKAQAHSPLSIARPDLCGSKRKASLSPPPAPVAAKLRRSVALIDDEDEELEEIEDEEEAKAKVRFTRRGVPRRLVKKLGDDFDRVASTESNGVDSDSMGLRTRSRRLIKGGGGGDAVKKVVEEEKGEKSNPKRNKNKSEAEKSPVSSTNGVRVRTSPRLSKRGSN
ncbi:uncharacterized protein LOC133297099 [Gastrolobium bilobum]|uniref:uncharacterized protein LOC133297099 n=1 Tax=Gastrolobium bilobum TaxID=150636 RepID=UPI002AAF3758|nr:uncharacterized protein LOC133297099 [Gastrolobium bilobum]